MIRQQECAEGEEFDVARKLGAGSLRAHLFVSDPIDGRSLVTVTTKD